MHHGLSHGFSGMHRLFEGQGQKEGHFSVPFCVPRGHFSAHFGSQEGILARVLAPKRAI